MDTNLTVGRKYVFASAFNAPFLAEVTQIDLQAKTITFHQEDGDFVMGYHEGVPVNLNSSVPYTAIEVRVKFTSDHMSELLNNAQNAGVDFNSRRFPDFIRSQDLTGSSTYIAGLGSLETLKAFGLTQKQLGELLEVKDLRNSSARERIVRGVAKSIVHIACSGKLGGVITRSACGQFTQWQAQPMMGNGKTQLTCISGPNNSYRAAITTTVVVDGHHYKLDGGQMYGQFFKGEWYPVIGMWD